MCIEFADGLNCLIGHRTPALLLSRRKRPAVPEDPWNRRAASGVSFWEGRCPSGSERGVIMTKSLCWTEGLSWLLTAPVWAAVGDLKPISIDPRKTAATGFEPRPIVAVLNLQADPFKVTIKEAAFTIQ